MARAKAWSFERPFTPQRRDAYRADQRAAVRGALAEYAPQTMAVFDVDFGHTEPQVVIPYGGMVLVDGPARRATVTYQRHRHPLTPHLTATLASDRAGL
jgi:hypothetical protein